MGAAENPGRKKDTGSSLNRSKSGVTVNRSAFSLTEADGSPFRGRRFQTPRSAQPARRPLNLQSNRDRVDWYLGVPKLRTVPTESTDNYLKAVFEITAVQERASTTEIARRLKIAAASVTGMLKKLASATPALVTYEKHRGAELTEEGQRRAIEVIRHHRLIESYLHEALDYGWDEVHDEAEKLEHFISEDLEDRMAAKLGFPEYDPHGHPIPRRNGTIPQCEDLPLRQIEAGATVRINRVSDDDPALLRGVSRLGIELYSILEVLEQRKASGEAILRDAAGLAVTLPREIVVRLRVAPVSGPVALEREAKPLASGSSGGDTPQAPEIEVQR